MDLTAVIGVVVGLFVLVPLFLLLAAMIKIDSRGHVIFRHRRVGTGGQPFTPFTAQGQIVPSNTRLVGTTTTSRQIQVALRLIF